MFRKERRLEIGNRAGGGEPRPGGGRSGSCLGWGGAIVQRMDYRGIITIEPGKRGGKPCIRGLRITVYDVLDYLAGGMTAEAIVADFPDLTLEDIRACLAFAADRERRLYTAPAA